MSHDNCIAKSVIKFAKIDTATSGNQSIVAAVTGKKIRVLRYGLIAGGTVSVKWRSASTDLQGAMPLVVNGGIAEAYCPVGIVETVAGEALNLNLSASIQVSGSITYQEV